MALGFFEGRRQLREAEDNLATVIREDTPAYLYSTEVRNPTEVVEAILEGGNVDTAFIDEVAEWTGREVMRRLDDASPRLAREEVLVQSQREKFDAVYGTLSGKNNFTARTDALRRLGVDEDTAAVMAQGIHPASKKGRRMIKENRSESLDNIMADIDQTIRDMKVDKGEL